MSEDASSPRSSGRMPRPQNDADLDGGNRNDESEDDSGDLKPWELCKYCRRLLSESNSGPARRSSAPEPNAAIQYAQRLKIISQMKHFHRTSVINSDRGFPASITDVANVEDTSLLVKWCVHDPYNVGGFQLYCDELLVKTVEHAKRTVALIRDVNGKEMHHIKLKVTPHLDDLVDADASQTLIGESTTPENCTCHYGRILVEKINEMRENYRQWTPSYYIYSPTD